MYATAEQMIDRLGERRAAELSAESGEIPDTAVIDAALVDAGSEINLTLATRWVTPVDTAVDATLAAALTTLTMDLAEYRLHLRRPPVPEDVKANRDRAVSMLTALGKGDATLPGLVAIPAPGNQGTVAEVHGPERVFTRETMAGL